MFCTHCGAAIDGGCRFCPSCGAPVETTVPAQSPSVSEREMLGGFDLGRAEPKKKNVKNAVFALVTGVSAVALTAGIPLTWIWSVFVIRMISRVVDNKVFIPLAIGCLFCSIPGLILSIHGLKRAKQYLAEDVRPRGMIKAARVLEIIGLILSIALMLGSTVVLAAAMAGAFR